jgi:DNA mismatch repair protein MutS2
MVPLEARFFYYRNMYRERAALKRLRGMLMLWVAVSGLLAVPHGRPAHVSHAARRAHAFAVAPAGAVDSLDTGADAAAAAHAADADLQAPPASIAQSVPDPIEATLELLEWPRLSAHVARYASSKHARELCAAGLELPATQLESETLLQETAEAYAIEQTLGRPLELKGFINWQPLVSLASKGAVLDGEQLASVSASLTAAAGLVKKLRAVDPDVALPGGGSLRLLPSLFEGVGVQAALKLAIDEAVDDAGFVRDSASQGLGEIRFAMRELAAAIRKTLAEIVAKRGECLANRTPTRRAERFVLQVVAKQRHRVPGVVRDVSGSGLTLFIEPKEIEG